MNRVKLKEKAKKSLEGKWKDTITLLVCMFAIFLGVGLVLGIFVGILHIENKDIKNTIIECASLIINGFFAFGSSSYFMKIARGKEVTWKELFSKTKYFVPYLSITLLSSLFIGLWTLLFIIPGIIAALNYSLMYVIYLDDPTLKPMEVLKKSKEMMYGHRLDYVVLVLSFLGWAILGAFTFGILYLWLIPYINVTTINFYDEIRKEKN